MGSQAVFRYDLREQHQCFKFELLNFESAQRTQATITCTDRETPNTLARK